MLKGLIVLLIAVGICLFGILMAISFARAILTWVTDVLFGGTRK